MKNFTLFNQVNLLQSFCKRMATATTSCAHSYKRYYLLLTILLFVGVNNAWAGHGFFTDNACGIKLNYSGSTTTEIKQNNSGASTYALKTVSKLYLKGWWLAAWENTDDFNGSEKGILYYKVYLDGNPSSSFTSKNHTYYNWGGWSKGSQNVWLGDDGLNINILDGLVGGNYIFEYYFTMGSEYLSNGSNNYKISFTYNPTFTVSVKAGTGGTVAASSVTAGNINAVTLPKATPNAGYSFLNWEVTTGDIKLSNETSASTATVKARSAGTVTASFKANQYTVTLDNQGATTPGAAEVIATYKAAMPSIANNLPKKTGYDFGGYWTVVGGTGTKYYNGTGSSAKSWDIPNNTTTLYAKWTAHEYTVHFNANGGEGTMEDQPFTYDVEKVLSPNSFNRTGYTFAGWATSAKGSVVYGDQQPVKNLTPTKNGDITLYAQWTPNTYTVQFNANGGDGSMDNQEFIYDETKNLSKNIFSKEGCIFTGWDTAADGSGTSYTDQQSVSNLVTEGTITLYAQWSTANCKWIEIDKDDIQPADEVVVTMGNSTTVYALHNSEKITNSPKALQVTVQDGVLMGDEFANYGWYLTKIDGGYQLQSCSDASKYLYGVASYITLGKTPTTFSIYQDLETKNECFAYIITDKVYYLNHGTEGGQPAWKRFETPSLKSNTLKFYKKTCLPDNEYWVTWDAREGLFDDGKSSKIEHYQAGDALPIPTPTRKGYNLTWNPTPEDIMPERNITYTAQWTLKTTTITLSPQDGTGDTQSVTATYSQPMPPITPPTLTGYNFQGYFSSNGGTGTKYYNADGTSATAWDREDENFTLIAYWTAKTTTVSFNQNGGDGGQTSAVTATYDQAMPAVAIPTREGHTFLGYFDAASEGTKYYNDDGSSAKNWDKEDATFTLYAQWKVNRYTVTWNANEGNWHGEETIQEVTYDYGTPIAEPENPVRAGWVFKGWTTDRSNIVEPAKTMPANNLEYFALWGEAYCENQYTFHTGTSNVWNKPTTQHCFDRKAGTEWQIENYVIPAGNDHTHFLVAYSGWPQRDQGSLGGHSKSVTSTWSETMYLAPAMNFESAANTPKVGHAAGAKGTLRIFDDSSWDNLCVGFIPDGYGITITGDTKNSSHAFHKTATDQMWETDVVTMPGVTKHKYAMGLATETEGTFVACDHTKAAENIEKMGVTGNVVYLKAEANWTDAGARFAACFMNSDKTERTWVDMNKIQLQYATNLYIATVPPNQKYVIFCRMNGATTANNWDNKWNQTSDIELPTDGLANVYTTTSLDGNSCTYTFNKATPQTQQNGKFRMWDNSNNKNWYVHFVPYYLLSYDANKGEGEMAPTEYNTEDANNNVTVAVNKFTRTGYDFQKWNTAANGSGTSYDANASYTMTQDAKLYAQWQAQTYNITYKDQGDADFSGTHGNNYPTKHTYDKVTQLVSPTRVGYTFDGWYTTPKCDGEPITQLGATEYTTDITLYAKWTFAMEYNITNTETIFITSAVGQKIKATTPLTLEVSNMPVGTTIDISAPHITFYDEKGNPVPQLTTKDNPETFSLAVAYTPEDENTTEQPTITLSVLGNEKTFNIISARSLPQNFVIAAKWGDNWYAMPANMDSQISPEGWLIEVNDKSNPTKAMAAPNTTKYGLRAVHTSNQSADRFAEFGERLVFVENVEEETPVAYKTLYNGGTTTNKTSIQVYAKYENYHTHDANPEHAKRYEWTPSTTDLKDYILTSAIVLSGDAEARTISLDNHGVFGTLLQNKSYEGKVRLLPVDNFYTPVELQIVEWKANSVSIMYTGAGTKATTQVGNSESEVQLLSDDKIKIDHAVYTLATSDLTAATNQVLTISIKDDAENTIGTLKLTIPWIVSGPELSTSRVASEVAQATDIVVLDDATLTADDTKYTYNDVVVYPGGKLVIGESGQLGMYSLTLRLGSSWGAAKYEHKYPEFVLNTTTSQAYSNTSGKINLDYVTTKDQYYTFVAPFAVTTKDIKYPVDIYGSNVKSANKGSFEFQYYDGAARAEGKTGWTVVPEGDDGADLEAGQGYTFLGMPKKINDNRQKYGIHRIPMKVSATEAQNHETTNQTVPLSVHLSTKNNNSGWNLIGNPYMTTITGLTNNDIQVGKLVHTNDANGNWTGGWHWDEETVKNNQRFLVIPSNDGQSYEAVQASNATLPAFKNFFVQIDSESDVNALSIPRNTPQAQLLAPVRRTAEEIAQDIELAIVLEQDAAHSDQMDFLINEIYSAEFDRNADFTKMLNATDFNLYGVHPYDNLSFVAMDNNTARGSVAIGYQVPQAGEYILRMSDKPYVMFDKIEALYVTDHEMSPEVTTDIMSEPYRFTVANAETNHTRFTVSVILKTEEDDGGGDVGTGVDNTTNSNTPCKFIYQDKMYILLNGVIYDAMGKQVQTINK